MASCDPIIKVKHLYEYQRYNLNGQRMNDEDPAVPCGLVAKSIFNDTFSLYKYGENGLPDESIRIFHDNIAWESDVKYRFANINNNLKTDNEYMD